MICLFSSFFLSTHNIYIKDIFFNILPIRLTILCLVTHMCTQTFDHGFDSQIRYYWWINFSGFTFLTWFNLIDWFNLTLGRPGGVGTTPPWRFFPYHFFGDSNWKNCFSVSDTRDRRHILAYVTSSWRCHVTYVMTSKVHDNRRKHRCFTIVRLSRYLLKYSW